ncbi:formin-like protein 4 [Wolffia australiana]
MADHLFLPLSLLLFFSSTAITSASGASNVQVFFPPSSIPAFPSLLPPPPPPPPAAAVAAAGKTSGVTITKAVVATAASTFVVSALLFFAAFRYTFKQKKIESYNGHGGAATAGGGGTLKAVIVDENGVDVVYRRDDSRLTKRCKHCHQEIAAAAPPEPRRSPKSRRQTSPLLQSDSLSSPDRVNDFFSNLSEASGSSSFTLATSPPLPPHPPPHPPRHPPPQPSLPLPPARQLPPSPTLPLNPPSAAPLKPPPPPKPAAPPPKPPAAGPPPPPPPPKPPAAAPKPPAAPPKPPAAPPKPPGGPPKAPAAPPKPPGAPPKPPGALPKPPGAPPKGPAAPPKPPGEAAAAAAEEEAAAQPKLKPLHWDKMTTANADHSVVWDRIKGGSFRFDDEQMVALFGHVAADRKPAGAAPSATSAASGLPHQIFLLDPRKSQNTAIVLRSLAATRAEITAALLQGRGLSADTLEKLVRLAPGPDEQAAVRAFDGDPGSLADAEGFLFELLRRVPGAFARAEAMLFRATYEPEVRHVAESLRAMALACGEMRNQGLFMRMLEAVLKAGNRMNAGTARGNAQAFNLSSLRKLSDVKSTDGKTTLLHFVVESVVRSEGKRCAAARAGVARSMSRSGSAVGRREEKEVEYLTLGLPVVGGLGVDYANVKKAAGVEPEGLARACASLAARLARARSVVGSVGAGDFAAEMSGFLDRAGRELDALAEEQRLVMEQVKETTEYYIVGSSKDKTAHTLQLFVIVRDFVGMVDQACVDIARGLQQRRKKMAMAEEGAAAAAAATAAAAEEEEKKPAPPRFPNLPPRFLSGGSRSSFSDDGGTDSDDDF